MRDHAVSSYNLEQARKLSHQLSRRGGPEVSGWNVAAEQRLKLPLPSKEERSSKPTTPAMQAKKVEPPPELDSWEPVIKWSLVQFGAESGFAVDTQGFVIATAGQVANDGFEAMGAELCYAMEQLERVDPASSGLVWVDLEFGRRRIVCLRVAPEEKEPMILGFVGAGTEYIAIRSQVEHVVLDAMQNF